MAECKTCGKKYHACSNCGLQNWEYNFCSVECWHKDPKNSEELKIALDLIDSLTKEQIVALYNMSYDDLGQGFIVAKMEEKLGKRLW